MSANNHEEGGEGGKNEGGITKLGLDSSGTFPPPQELHPGLEDTLSKLRVHTAPQDVDAFGSWLGASVLPFAVAPTGDVYVLLGKEREDQTWKCGSNRWSDFGGRRSLGSGNTVGDRDCAETAGREFVEESCCVVKDPAKWFTSSTFCPSGDRWSRTAQAPPNYGRGPIHGKPVPFGPSGHKSHPPTREPWNHGSAEEPEEALARMFRAGEYCYRLLRTGNLFKPVWTPAPPEPAAMGANWDKDRSNAEPGRLGAGGLLDSTASEEEIVEPDGRQTPGKEGEGGYSSEGSGKQEGENGEGGILEPVAPTPPAAAGGGKSYVTFVCRVGWDPSVVEKFHTVVGWLGCLYDAIRLFHMSFNDGFVLPERARPRWVTLGSSSQEEILLPARRASAINFSSSGLTSAESLCRMPAVTLGMVFSLLRRVFVAVGDEASVYFLDRQDRAAVVTAVSWDPFTRFGAVGFQSSSVASAAEIRFALSEHAIRDLAAEQGILALRELVSRRERVKTLYRLMPPDVVRHPAVQATFAPDGELTSVVVKTEYLEKQAIQWWSLPRVVELMANNGIYRTEQTRNSCNEMLSVVCQLLSADFGRKKRPSFDSHVLPPTTTTRPRATPPPFLPSAAAVATPPFHPSFRGTSH